MLSSVFGWGAPPKEEQSDQKEIATNTPEGSPSALSCRLSNIPQVSVSSEPPTRSPSPSSLVGLTTTNHPELDFPSICDQPLLDLPPSPEFGGPEPTTSTLSNASSSTNSSLLTWSSDGSSSGINRYATVFTPWSCSSDNDWILSLGQYPLTGLSGERFATSHQLFAATFPDTAKELDSIEDIYMWGVDYIPPISLPSDIPTRHHFPANTYFLRILARTFTPALVETSRRACRGCDLMVALANVDISNHGDEPKVKVETELIEPELEPEEIVYRSALQYDIKERGPPALKTSDKRNRDDKTKFVTRRLDLRVIVAPRNERQPNKREAESRVMFSCDEKTTTLLSGSAKLGIDERAPGNGEFLEETSPSTKTSTDTSSTQTVSKFGLAAAKFTADKSWFNTKGKNVAQSTTYPINATLRPSDSSTEWIYKPEDNRLPGNNWFHMVRHHNVFRKEKGASGFAVDFCAQVHYLDHSDEEHPKRFTGGVMFNHMNVHNIFDITISHHCILKQFQEGGGDFKILDHRGRMSATTACAHTLDESKTYEVDFSATESRCQAHTNLDIEKPTELIFEDTAHLDTKRLLPPPRFLSA